MKTLFFTLAVCLTTTFLIAQINLFGIDLSKLSNSKESLVYRKLNCTTNPYYTIAEYKKFDAENARFIVFDIENVKHQTNQMQQAANYTKILSQQISNTIGNATEVFVNTNPTNENEAQYYWIIKENEKYIVAKLFYSEFSHRNNLRVFFYNTYDELNVGFEYLTKTENKHRNTINTQEVLTKL